MRLECYEILTNKNDVEKRNGVSYKPLNIYARRQLIGCQYMYTREKENERARKEDVSPPITFVYHIYLRSFSFLFFFFVVEARRKKKDLLIEKKREKKKTD